VSPILAILLISALVLAVAAPALLAFLRQDVGWRTGTFYGVAVMALLAWHVGFALGPMPTGASLVRPGTPGAAPSGDRCEQALSTAERARIILDRSNPSRLVVSQSLWAQVPEGVRTALVDCAASLRPEGAGGSVEVVNRTG
jgi:hypothetical protein